MIRFASTKSGLRARHGSGRRPHGTLLVDALVAVALLAAAAVPLLGLLQGGAKGIRPRESDLIVGNVTMDLLERLATPPTAPDPLRTLLAGEPTLDAEGVLRVTRAFVGPVPDDVAEALTGYAIVLEVSKRNLNLGRSYLDADRGAGMEVWTVEARWRVGERRKARRFLRVTAAR